MSIENEYLLAEMAEANELIDGLGLRVIEFLNKVGELSSCFNEKGKI